MTMTAVPRDKAVFARVRGRANVAAQETGLTVDRHCHFLPSFLFSLTDGATEGERAIEREREKRLYHREEEEEEEGQLLPRTDKESLYHEKTKQRKETKEKRGEKGGGGRVSGGCLSFSVRPFPERKRTNAEQNGSRFPPPPLSVSTAG